MKQCPLFIKHTPLSSRQHPLFIKYWRLSTNHRALSEIASA